MAMLLCGTARIHDIISLKSRLNFELMTLRRKLIDLQTYSASIGDGEVSAEDMMNSPASMFQNMSIFMGLSTQRATNAATNNLQMFMTMNKATVDQIQPALQEDYKRMVWNNLYKQETEKFAQAETKRLNVEETKINQEIAEKETRLQMLDKEEETTKEVVKKAAEESAPNYVA